MQRLWILELSNTSAIHTPRLWPHHASPQNNSLTDHSLTDTRQISAKHGSACWCSRPTAMPLSLYKRLIGCSIAAKKSIADAWIKRLPKRDSQASSLLIIDVIPANTITHNRIAVPAMDSGRAGPNRTPAQYLLPSPSQTEAICPHRLAHHQVASCLELALAADPPPRSTASLARLHELRLQTKATHVRRQTARA